MENNESSSAPLFSIITVCRNASATIERTLKSVKEQTCGLYEYIVIDGASTDDTAELARKAGIRNTVLISEPDRGIYDAMNKGMACASGEYLIFLNAGDAFHSPGTLQLVADAIMDGDFPGIVYGQTDIVNNEGRRLGTRHLTAPETLTLDSFKDGMVVCHQAFIAYHRVTGPYDLRYRYSADYDWCVRCLQHSRRNAYIPEVLIDYLYEGATTRNRRRSLNERFRIMAHYYGFFPTLWRHLCFLPRFLRRRKEEKNFTK